MTGYRIVEPAELKDLYARGQFYSPPYGDTPTGAAGKWFYSTPEEAIDTAASWSSQGGGPFTLIKADIPSASITYTQAGIDGTSTMPFGKLGYFSEFDRGLNNATIYLPPKGN